MMIMNMMIMIIMVMMTREEVEGRKFCTLFLCGLNMKISSQGKSCVKRGRGSFLDPTKPPTFAPDFSCFSRFIKHPVFS